MWAFFTLKILHKMRMSEKCRNNNKTYNDNSDNALTSRRTDGGKHILGAFFCYE